MPNQFADELEYFIRKLPGRERAIISLHPHNDRGTGVATAEMGLLAGADRVEATLFGNGERTGNVDMVTVAMNMYTQGIDPELDFSNHERDPQGLREGHQNADRRASALRGRAGVHRLLRQPSGRHQQGDAVHGRSPTATSGRFPICPSTPQTWGVTYEPIIRINSQSGKGGAAFIMAHNFGFELPKAMHPEFSDIVQAETDRIGHELKPEAILELFKREYRRRSTTLIACINRTLPRDSSGRHLRTSPSLAPSAARASAPSPSPARATAPSTPSSTPSTGRTLDRYTFVDYKEHAINTGSDSQAVAYIHLRIPDGTDVFGVGMDHNISMASIKGVLSAINRAKKLEAKKGA